MKKKISAIVTGILIISSVNVYAAGTNDLKNKLDENNSRIEQKQKEKTIIEKDKNTVNYEINQLLKEMDELEYEIKAISEKITQTKNEINEKSNNIYIIENDILESEKEIEKQENEIEEKNKELDETNEILNQRIRADYKFNNYNSTIFMLLESESIIDFAQRVIAVERMAKKDKEIIERVEELIIELDIEKEQLNDKLLAQTESKNNLELEKNSLEDKKLSLDTQNKNLNVKISNLKEMEKEKKEKFSELASQEQEVSSEILDMREENEALENEIQNLIKREQAKQAAAKAAAEKAAAEKAAAEKAAAEKAAADKAANKKPGNSGGSSSNEPKPEEDERPQVSSGYIRPLNGRINSPYGMRLHPIYGIYRMHTGVDIPAASGTPIKATRSGVVIRASYWGGYGNTVLILHDNGMSSLYAHMSGFNTSVGSNVSQGQTIGYVGSTGDSTGPHLHFEIRKDGNHVNPSSYIGY